MSFTQWVEREITIAAATLVPVIQIVSKNLETIVTNTDSWRLATQASDFELLDFLLMLTSSEIRSVPRTNESRTTRTSVAVGFEPTPTPEEEIGRLHIGVRPPNFNSCGKTFTSNSVAL